MNKLMLLIAVLTMSSAASADVLLNGIGYDADQLCFDGTYLEAQVTKSRDLIRQNGEGEYFVVGSVTVQAGDQFMWRKATSYKDNGQGDSVAIHFDRNGNPVDIQLVKTAGDKEGDVTVIKTPIPSC